MAGGYHRILAALVGKIEALGLDTVLGSRIAAIRRGDPGPAIEFEDGSTRRFDRVIVTIAAPLAARLCVDLTEDERRRLTSKRYIGIVCVSLLLRAPLGPYYVTNLTDEWVPFSAVIDMSAVVDRRHFGGSALVYLPKYVAPDDPLFQRTDESIVDEFVAALRRMYPDFAPESVIAARVSRAPAVFAMTTLGYSRSLPAIATSVPQLVHRQLRATGQHHARRRRDARARRPRARGARRERAAPGDVMTSERKLPDLAGLSGLISGAVLLYFGFEIWREGDPTVQPIAMVASLACYVAGVALLVYASLDGVPGNRKENAAAAGLVFAFCAFATAWVVMHGAPIGSDSLLFNVYSASIASHGGNPYAQSMEPAFNLYNVSKALVTPTTRGTEIYLQSYPAVSFLIYVPFAWLKIDPVWVDIDAHIALLLLLIWVAPRPLKALAPLIVFVDRSYTDYTLGGVTDIVWVLLIALTARFWNTRPAVAAIFLGLACASKQPPWFIAPFAFVAWASWAWERRRIRVFLVPAVAFALAFLIPNATYIAAGPALWLRGVSTPITGNLLAFGSGAMQLVTGGVFGVDLETMSIASSAMLLVLLIGYAIDTRRFACLPFLAPGLALFFATRELQNYFMWWPPLLAVFLFSPQREPAPTDRPVRVPLWLAPAAVGVLGVALLGFIVVRGAKHTSADVQVSLERLGYDSTSGAVGSLDVRLTNPSPTKASKVRLGVLVQGNGDDYSYWLRDPQEIEAGNDRLIHLKAPSNGAELQPLHDTVQVVAIDAASGEQSYSAAHQLLTFFNGLANGQLSAWDEGPPPAPAGWDYSETDFATGYLRRAGSPQNWTLAFSVPPPREEESRVVAVSQRFTGGFQRFNVKLEPHEGYTDGADPRSLFGVQVVDGAGHHAYYAVDPALHSPQRFTDGTNTVFAVPGSLDRWNDVVVDAGDLAKSGFRFSETQPLEIAIVGIQHNGETAKVRGEFGGVTSE